MTGLAAKWLKALSSWVKTRIRLITISGLASFLVLLVFEWYGGAKPTLEAACTIGFVRGTCQYLSIGDVPSAEEESEWLRAKSSSNCNLFRVIQAKNGAYADEARNRLALATNGIAVRVVQIPLSVPIGFERNGGIAATDKRLKVAQSNAERQCRDYSQSFKGEAQPGLFVANAPPTCEKVGDLFLCRIEGYAKCTFKATSEAEVCLEPPTKVSE